MSSSSLNIEDLEQRIQMMIGRDRCSFTAQCTLRDYITEQGCSIPHDSCGQFVQYVVEYTHKYIAKYAAELVDSGEMKRPDDLKW